MQNSIKIITPPDLIFDQTESMLLVCPSAELKKSLEEYLSTHEDAVNIYLFSNETDIKWLLITARMTDVIIIDIDNCGQNVSHFLGYLLTLPNTYYKCEHMQVQWDLLNQNRFFDFPNIKKEENERQSVQ
jgi:hypothetical protein